MDDEAIAPRCRRPAVAAALLLGGICVGGCGETTPTSGDANYSQKFDKPAAANQAPSEPAKSPTQSRRADIDEDQATKAAPKKGGR
jgi:hypothetical protein